MKVIYGTQSTIYINRDTGIVKKVSTERGKQDTIDQIAFYTNLPELVRPMFPHILDYQNGPDEYYYTYSYISGMNLRDILLGNKLDSFWLRKTVYALDTINRTIHTLKQQSASKMTVYLTYLQRSSQRVAETRKMLGEDSYILDETIYINNKKYPTPIALIIDVFKENLDILLPNCICTTHGQLGPSHLFLDEESDAFTLIDPKGFDNLYDPIIDVCKIGKAMLFATEWLEENKYSIEYFIDGGTIYIHKYEVEAFETMELQKKYDILLNSLDFCKDAAVQKRIIAMICADLIGGLPYAYVAGGKERVIALLVQIARASELICNAYQ